MDADATAREFTTLVAAVYLHTYRRRDPREARISGEALAMLQHLRDGGPLTVSEAARHFDRAQSSVSERIRRLADRGLVESIRDERDRRRHLVWMTEAGEESLRRELEPFSAELLARAAARMSAADRRSLIRGVRALADAAREAARTRRRR